jgi:hypothetical protein
MALNRDWFPKNREEQLAMAKNRGLILPAKKTDTEVL